jgi:hypothetical protein
MSPTQKFRTSDLMRALDSQAHELRAWLRLEPLVSREKKRRSATTYTALDLLFLAIIKRLDTAGFAPKALRTFSASLYKALQRPVSTGALDELLLYHGVDGCWKVGAGPEGANAMQLRIPLRPLRVQVLQYTGAHLISGQTELNLLAPIQSPTSPSTANPGRARKASR